MAFHILLMLFRLSLPLVHCACVRGVLDRQTKNEFKQKKIFLVRYDGDRQASLSKHTDDGSITFSVLLSHGFEGGGTRYWNRFAGDDLDNLGAPFSYILPKAGMMTTFPAMIQHEGVQTAKGHRYILIGFWQ